MDNAEDLVCEEYIANYEGKEGPKATTPDTVSIDTPHALFVCLNTNSQGGDDDDNNNHFTAFVNISVTKAIPSQTSELDGYLHKLVENVKDPLKWWIGNRHVYPNLFRMALDFLSIPGMFFFALVYS